jgi:hypothetical protein
MKYKFYVSSPLNITFDYEEIVDLEDYIDKEQFEAMEEQEQSNYVHAVMIEILFNGYVEFGYWKEEDAD